MKKERKQRINKKSILGLILILLVLILLIVYFVIENNNTYETTNNELKNTITKLNNENDNKQELIERLDRKNVIKEEATVRNRAKEFVEILYVMSPNINDKERYSKAKKVMNKNLADQYFGEKRKSPIKYETDIKNVRIYSERYSPKKESYHMFLTLTQEIKKPDGSVDSSRKVASELDLKQKNEEWKVTNFKQFSEEDSKYK